MRSAEEVSGLRFPLKSGVIAAQCGGSRDLVFVKGYVDCCAVRG